VPPQLTVLFCADPLTPGRVDPYFAAQATAVRRLGGTVALIDHDALVAGDATAAVRRVPRDLGPVWYRGWMIPSSRYEDLAASLADRATELIVTPDRYRAAHELPGWYDIFATTTPVSVWAPRDPGDPPTGPEVARLISPLGPGRGIVKDYVKSRKHEWEEACYIPDLTDVGNVTEVIARMVELQESSLYGGIVVRRFEDFQRGPDRRTIEARVWWLDGAPVLVSAHPDNPADVPVPEPDLDVAAASVANVGCRWITTDMALRDDGVWRVVEVGDAQVSGLPEHVDATVLFGPLAAAVAR